MSHKVRLILVAAVIFAWAGIILSRLVTTQLLRSDELRERAQSQYQQRIILNPKRGTIYDRHGRTLAINVDSPSVYAVPDEVQDCAAAAGALSPVLGVSVRSLEERLSRDRSFVWLQRKITPAQQTLIVEAGLSGIHFVTESKRIYPSGRLASHVLGFAGIDNDGLAGIEYQYDRYLRGEPGLMIGVRGARGALLFSAGKVIKAPTGGMDLTLTIDSAIQFAVQEELRRAVEETASLSGTAIAMDPHTGQILAMASAPDYDPNRPAEASASDRSNRAVMHAYEPGSTFKLVVAAAALESGLVEMDDEFDCEMGSIDIGETTIHDHSAFGKLSFRSVVEHSSNVGMIKVGMRVGKHRAAAMARRFGFGQPTGIDLPAENRGILREPENWSAVSIGYFSIGQELSANSVQILLQAAAVANGGYRVRPYVIQSVTDTGGRVFYEAEVQKQKILSDRTVELLRELTAGVVRRGSGTRASVAGVSAGGKTGTAEVADPRGGGYIPGAYVASFIGYFPQRNPQVVILCLLERPQGEYYGGRVAAPLFSAIATRVANILQIPDEHRDTLMASSIYRYGDAAGASASSEPPPVGNGQ